MEERGGGLLGPEVEKQLSELSAAPVDGDRG